MDQKASPLVLTKLRVPAPRPRLISRTRLIDLLTLENGTGLLLVCAPAGYGKTTLLAEWAHFLLRNGVAVAWYALDPSDDDPIPFGAYLVASLTQALSSFSEMAPIAQFLRASPEIDLSRILQSVINAVVSSDKACVLILDDYHLIASPAIHSALAYLLEHLPENLRIAIGSRSDPPLPMARLRAGGRLLEVRSSDLRFTADETAIFLNEAMRLELPLDLVAELGARTEGWIAGLQLAALSLAGRPDKESFIASFTGSHRYLVEYLLEEVFGRLPEAVQSFLLSTSILERLCASLCDAILSEGAKGQESRGAGEQGRPSLLHHPCSLAQEILEYLEHANLFLIPLDDERQWYRYHHLFRDFLQTRLFKNQPERVNSLHRAASEWHEAHGSLRDAVRHALQTHDWAYAADMVERHAISMMAHSEFATVYEWCAAFPEEVMRARPPLCIFQGYALVLGYRSQNRGRIEERARQIEQAAAMLEDKQLAQVLIGQAVTMRTFLAAMIPNPVVDPQSQLELAQKALDLLAKDDPARSAMMLAIGYAHMALHDAQAGNRAMEEAWRLSLPYNIYYGMVEAVFHQARMAHHQGRLRHAVEICRQGQEKIASILAHPEQELPAMGCLDIAMGCILLEQDRLADAEEALLHGLHLIEWGMTPFPQMTAWVALFRLREIQGRPAEALEYLIRLEETWPDLSFCAHGLRVVHALWAAPDDPETLAEAAAWCQGFAPSLDANGHLPGMGPFGAAEAYYLAYLAWARAQVALGKPETARVYIERQLELASAHSLTNRVIELSLLEAQTWEAQGDPKRAREALEEALAAAQPEGYVRIFDQGPALTRLLIEAAQGGIYKKYIERILASIGMPEAFPLGQEASAAYPARMPYRESLSERELEVLRLMSQGASNYEIAEQLVITAGTVKSHINHILRKLDAHNRTEAVARARGWGLLDF